MSKRVLFIGFRWTVYAEFIFSELFSYVLSSGYRNVMQRSTIFLIIAYGPRLS